MWRKLGVVPSPPLFQENNPVNNDVARHRPENNPLNNDMARHRPEGEARGGEDAAAADDAGNLLNLPRVNRLTVLEVIVKVQRYHINQGTSYSGHWHMEGTSNENIVAAGSYYVEVAPELSGGELGKYAPHYIIWFIR